MQCNSKVWTVQLSRVQYELGTAQWAVQWHQIHTYERNIIWYELRCHHVRVKRPALVFGPLCSCSEPPTIHKTHLCCFGRPYMIHVCSICEPRDTANEVAHYTALKLFTLHTKLAIIFVIWLYCTHFKLPCSWAQLGVWELWGKRSGARSSQCHPVTLSLKIHSGLLHAANHLETIEDGMDVFSIQYSNRHRQVSKLYQYHKTSFGLLSHQQFQGNLFGCIHPTALCMPSDFVEWPKLRFSLKAEKIGHWWERSWQGWILQHGISDIWAESFFAPRGLVTFNYIFKKRTVCDQ